MPTLTLHFDFSDQTPPEDPDLFLFRRELSRKLEKVLHASGSARWRGGRFACGVVTIFIEVNDPQAVLPHVRSLLATGNLRRAKITVSDHKSGLGI